MTEPIAGTNEERTLTQTAARKRNGGLRDRYLYSSVRRRDDIFRPGRHRDRSRQSERDQLCLDLLGRQRLGKFNGSNPKFCALRRVESK